MLNESCDIGINQGNANSADKKRDALTSRNPGKVLINVACGANKSSSSSSSQSVGSTNSVLGFSTYSLISLLQVGLSLALPCHRLNK